MKSTKSKKVNCTLYKVLRTNDVYFGIFHNITFRQTKQDHTPKFFLVMENADLSSVTIMPTSPKL